MDQLVAWQYSVIISQPASLASAPSEAANPPSLPWPFVKLNLAMEYAVNTIIIGLDSLFSDLLHDQRVNIKADLRIWTKSGAYLGLFL